MAVRAPADPVPRYTADHEMSMDQAAYIGVGEPDRAEFVNCLFHGHLPSFGGASEIIGADVMITNSTITGNCAFSEGAGMYIDLTQGNGSCIIQNAVFHANDSKFNGPNDDITYYGDLGQLSIEHSIIFGRPGTNFDADQMFMPFNGPNPFELMPRSPAIDSGGNTQIDTPRLVDMNYDPRYVDDPGAPDTGVVPAPIVDRGAFEFQGTSPSPDLFNCFKSGGTIGDRERVQFVRLYETQSKAADINSDGFLSVADFLEFFDMISPQRAEY